jgi:hypothetical protein
VKNQEGNMKRSDVAAILMEDQESPFVIGEKVFIRTVTFHQTGRIVAIKSIGSHYFLVLEDAAWVASSGRFTAALETGVLDEVEPVQGLVRVSVGTIVDICPWNHPLPREVK